MLANPTTIRQAKGGNRIRQIAEQVYTKNHKEAMLQLRMERAGGEGGFFPQAGTNLTARRGTRLYDQDSPSEESRSQDPWERLSDIGLRQRSGRRSDPSGARRTILQQFLPPDNRTLDIL